MSLISVGILDSTINTRWMVFLSDGIFIDRELIWMIIFL